MNFLIAFKVSISTAWAEVNDSVLFLVIYCEFRLSPGIISRVKVQMIFILLSSSVIFSVVSRFSSSEALDVCSDEF